MKASSMRSLPLACLALAACTSSPSSGHAPDRAGASQAFGAANTRMNAAVNALNTHAAASLVGGAVNFSAPCGVAGTVGLTGTFQTDGARTTLDVTAAFTGCREPGGQLDGSVAFTSTNDTSKLTDRWRGTLDFTDAAGAWQCAFDFTATIDATGTHYAGTICGYDAHADLGL
jgi:hypothetical protein